MEKDGDDDGPVGPTRPVLRINEVSSLLDLETEFLRRKQAATQQTGGGSTLKIGGQFGLLTKEKKGNVFALTKEEKRVKADAKEQRTSRIRANADAIRKEESERERQKAILEQKTAIYDRMTQGDAVPVFEDGRPADFLVDFHAKKRELEQRQTEQFSTSSAAAKPPSSLSKIVDLDDTYDSNPLIVHYDHSEEKGRVFGASHVALPSRNEDARQQKIRELKAATEQTRVERAKRKRLRTEQRVHELRRLNCLRAQDGLPPLEATSSDEEEEQEEEATVEKLAEDEQANLLANIPLPPSSSAEDGGGQSSSSSSFAAADGGPSSAKKPRGGGVREWDRGKPVIGGGMGYTRWIAAQRDERDDDFRPPNFYYSK